MKLLIQSRFAVQKQIYKMLSVLALFSLPVLAWSQDAANDVVQAPKEFNPFDWDWMFIASCLLVVLIILVIARSFDIGALAEKLTGKKVVSWNNVNAWMAIIFLLASAAGVAYELIYHGKFILLGDAASEHGESLDSMFNWTFAFTFAVFVITEVLLFWFMFRYKYKEGQKALYQHHNNKLEVIWTIIPAIVLTFLVLRGFNTWSKITSPDKISKDAQTIEVFAYQFGWKARYAGEDNKLGEHHFTFISGKNPLGLAVTDYVDSLDVELKADIKNLEKLLASVDDSARVWIKALSDFEGKQNLTAYPEVYKELHDKATDIKSGAYKRKLENDIKRKRTTIKRISEYRSNKLFFNNSANDDKVTTEIVLVKNKPYVFKLRARDVIHSAYMPEFRAQMNVVPGMSTQFAFTPIKTTAEARKSKKDSAYDYYLFCNKICGAAHYNMKIKVTVVETVQEYKDWLAAQAAVNMPAIPAPTPQPEGDKSKDSTKVKNIIATAK